MGILLRPGSQLDSDDRETQNIDTMIIIVININCLLFPYYIQIAFPKLVFNQSSFHRFVPHVVGFA